MQLFSVPPLDFIDKPLEYDAVKKAVGIFLKIEGLDFLQIHPSYVINQDYVTEYTYGRVKMFSGDELNISRRYRNQVRKQIIDNRRSQG